MTIVQPHDPQRFRPAAKSRSTCRVAGCRLPAFVDRAWRRPSGESYGWGAYCIYHGVRCHLVDVTIREGA